MPNNYRYGNSTPMSIFIHVTFWLIHFASNYLESALPNNHSHYARRIFSCFQSWVTSVVKILNTYLIRISVHNGSERDVA